MTVFALLALFLRGATCQFPPKPQGITVLESRFHNDVKISYKEVSQWKRHHAYNQN